MFIFGAHDVMRVIGFQIRSEFFVKNLGSLVGSKFLRMATEVVSARGGRPGSPVLFLARCVFLSQLHIYASPPIISLSGLMFLLSFDHFPPFVFAIYYVTFMCVPNHSFNPV